jgi:hypothetical protein
MPQTTGAISGVNCEVELFVGAAWEDISGVANQVGNAEQRRMSGEGYTFDGDTAIVKGGKREPVEVNFRVVFSSAIDEGWQYVRQAFETDGGDDVDIRWTPEPGGLVHSIDGGIVTRFNYPSAAADEAAPIQCEFTVRAAKIDTA